MDMKEERIKKIVRYVIHAIYIILAVGIMVYCFVFSDDLNNKFISKVITLIVTYIILKLINIVKYGRFGYKELADRYKDAIEGGFVDNKRAYNQLMKAVFLYDKDQYNKSIDILDKLECKCKKVADFKAVYFMKAICYNDMHMFLQAIDSYNMLLKYDMNHSVAWSNLGLVYQECSNMDKAYEAYQNAIRSNPLNYLAYNNIAMYYLDVGDWIEAEYYALKALEIAPNMSQAMEKLAIVYKVTGDDVQFEKYRKLYAVNGGNIKQLDEYLNSI